MSSPISGKITKSDIEAKLRQVKGEITETGSAARAGGMKAGGAIGAALLAVSFLLGRRRGKRRSTTVEIRRV